MGTKNKILLLGVSVFLAGTVIATNLLHPSKAFALFAVTSQAQIEDGIRTLEFLNTAQITGTFAGKKITFTDTDPFDATYNYKPSDTTAFCSSGDTVSGITLNQSPIPPKSSISASIDLDFTVNGTEAGCADTSPNKYNDKLIIGADKAADAFAWNTNTLVAASGIVLEPTADPKLYVEDPAKACGGGTVVVIGNSDESGTLYLLTTGNIGGSEEFAYLGFSGCYKIRPAVSISIAGVKGQALSGGFGTGTCLGDDCSVVQEPTCEVLDDLGFGWVFCKVLRGIDAVVTTLFDEVDDQLCVKVGKSTTEGGGGQDVCAGKDNGDTNYLTKEVKEAWSGMRVIATSILVIAMLIGIVGQAAGGKN